MPRLFVAGAVGDAGGRAAPRVNNLPPASPSLSATPLPSPAFSSSRTALRLQQLRGEGQMSDEGSAVKDVEAALVACSPTTLFPPSSPSYPAQCSERPLDSPCSLTSTPLPLPLCQYRSVGLLVDLLRLALTRLGMDVGGEPMTVSMIQRTAEAANGCSLTATMATLMAAAWLLRTEMEGQRERGGERGEGGGGHLNRLRVVVSCWKRLWRSDWLKAALATEAAVYTADELGGLSCHRLALALHQRCHKAWDVAREEAREEAKEVEEGAGAVQGRR